MSDSNPFDEFINGLDLPEPDGEDPMPFSPEDADAAAGQITERVRSRMHAILKRVVNQGPDKWSEHLNVIQLFVRNELLNSMAPRTGSLDHMTKKEVAMSSAYSLITLAWLIYDEVASSLRPPGNTEW